MGQSSRRKSSSRKKLGPYQTFMRKEIADIKSKKQNIPHKEAFNQATQNWHSS